MPFHTAQDIRAVSRRTVRIFQSHGLPCCLVGSSATTLWGVDRVPNDIDLVVMSTSHTQEGLKQLLAVDPAYIFKSSTNPRNTYKVVWYRLPGRSDVEIKVDILLPPIMDIPWVPSNRFVWFKNRTLPSMPLLPLLLLKLQAWDDHRNASIRRSDLRAKQYVDVQDIDQLLIIAAKEGVHHKDSGWLPSTFVSEGERRVRSYTIAYPASVKPWKALGFEGSSVLPTYGRIFERSSVGYYSRRRLY